MNQRQERIYYEVPHEQMDQEETPLNQTSQSGNPGHNPQRRPLPSRPVPAATPRGPQPRLQLTSERYHFDLEISDDETSDDNGQIKTTHNWISETRLPYTLVYHSLLTVAILGYKCFSNTSGPEMLDYTVASWMHLGVSVCFSVRIFVLSVMSLVRFYRLRFQREESGEPKLSMIRIFFEMFLNALVLAVNLVSIMGLIAYALRIGPFAHLETPAENNGDGNNREYFVIRLLPALMGVCITQALIQVFPMVRYQYTIGLLSIVSALIAAAICIMPETSSPGLSYIQNYLDVSDSTPWYLSPSGIVVCHVIPLFFCSLTTVLDIMKSFMDTRRGKFWRTKKLATNIILTIMLLTALGVGAYFIYCSALAGGKYPDVYLTAHNATLEGNSTTEIAKSMLKED